MGCATMDFTNLGDFAATALVNVSGLGDQQLHLESEISPLFLSLPPWKIGWVNDPAMLHNPADPVKRLLSAEL